MRQESARFLLTFLEPSLQTGDTTAVKEGVAVTHEASGDGLPSVPAAGQARQSRAGGLILSHPFLKTAAKINHK